MTTEESIEVMLSEIRERLILLKSCLPSRVDAMAVSPTAKLPFKALIYREALIWRMAELSQSALDSFDRNMLSSAILLARAAVETSAALWYLSAKLDAALQATAVGDIDSYLMRLAMGSKINRDIMPEAINVLTFVDCMDKDIEGFRHQYDFLSEYAHPNWAGTALLYSKDDPKNLWTDFGQNPRESNGTKHAGIINLCVALEMFERSYNRITERLPSFIRLCESELEGEQIIGNGPDR
jgi:hypothetical protein